MTHADSYSIWQKEKELLDELRLFRPELLVPQSKNSESILKEVGIQKTQKVVGKAYLKSTYTDFIVEEIQNDGTVITIDSQGLPFQIPEQISPKGLTVYATLVKIGISTLEATTRIAEALGIDKSAIGYAGIKDAVAVTAQKISIRGGVSIEQVQGLKLPQIFLKDLYLDKGVVTMGGLYGNRFSIVLRLIGEAQEAVIAEKINTIQRDGLVNYYGPQRFGSPRFQSHYLGKLVLTAQYEELVQAILIRSTPFEWPIVVQLREKASQVYGKWQEMKDIFSTLPYIFRQEIILLDRLCAVGSRSIDWLKILSPLFEQLDFWAKSYASLLANELLSDAQSQNKKLSDTIPLLLNTKDTHEVDVLYSKYLERDNVQNFRSVLQRSFFIRKGENSYLQTRLFPKNIVYKFVEGNFVIGFDLPKGAYATTVLYELFDIVERDIQFQELYFDSKRELQTGSLDLIKTWLDNYSSKTNEASQNEAS